MNEIYKNIVLDWYNDSIKIRGYKNPITVRNIANDVDDAAVEAMMNVVRKNTKLFSEYFALKHKMNKDRGAVYELSRYHLYAPYDVKLKSKYDYETSKKIVLDTYKQFDERFYNAAKSIWDAKHVHSHPKKNKRSGAFCSMINNGSCCFFF